MSIYGKRHISICLLAAIGLGSIACGTVDGPNTFADTASVNSDSASVTTEDVKDNLPELDYNGYEFRIFTRVQAWYHGNWIAEEANGEVLNDAIYNRNQRVAERLNIQFSEVSEGNTDNARNAILAGDDAYDVINGRCAIIWSYAEEGLLYDMSQLPYVDLTKGYWDSSLNECLSVCGKQYFAVGANNITSYDYTHVLVFNKDMVEKYALESPYSLVRSGKWTFDAFEKAVKNVNADLNGDSVMDDKDAYGFISQPKAVLPGFWIGAEVLSVNKNAKNEPVFTMSGDTKFLEVFDTIYKITRDSGAWFYNTKAGNNDQSLITMFQNNQGLFMDMTFYYIEALRGMDTDFGIIPYPKYTEEQDNYYARIEGCELSGIPVTTTDLSRTSAILEAIAAESVATVLPAYYDVALKAKYTRDDDSAEMLDFIFNNRIFDYGDTIWCDKLRDGVFEAMYINDDRAIASKLASINNIMEDAVKKTVQAFTQK